MHIYVFGSLCRGEVSFGSDIDVLAVSDGFDTRFDPDTFSIYSYARIKEIWGEGNPFAWHLSQEARLIFTSSGADFLAELGKPARYTKGREDCEKFLRVYQRAIESLNRSHDTLIFDLSAIFLSARNFATCFALGTGSVPNFSRHAAKRLGPRSIRMSENAFRILEHSRILSTRGVGPIITWGEVEPCWDEICDIRSWMDKLLTEFRLDGRIQQ